METDIKNGLVDTAGRRGGAGLQTPCHVKRPAVGSCSIGQGVSPVLCDGLGGALGRANGRRSMHSHSWVPGGSAVKKPPTMQEMQVHSLGQEDPLEKETATHSSILAWRIPWTEEPGRIQSMGSRKSWTWLSYSTTSHSWFRLLWNQPTWHCKAILAN